MVPRQSKRHRFREHLLWYLDGPSYYNNDTAKYLMYDNIQLASLGVIHELLALASALRVAEILGRTLILPLL